MTSNPLDLPVPPIELRRLVGPTDVSAFDNPDGGLVHPHLDPAVYESVLDFGCGCGRVARQLMQQQVPVGRYIGLDLHRGMIDWCKRNLEPLSENFRFVHHDVFSMGFNPGEDKPATLPFPVEDDSVTLVHASSVFTHLLEPHAVHYLQECARVIRPGGVLNATWFFFDKVGFPMMQDFQNALYINHIDPTNATIFDRTWLLDTLSELGLVITHVIPPVVRGFQWTTVIEPADPRRSHVEFPDDEADAGLLRASMMPADAHTLGYDDAATGSAG